MNQQEIEELRRDMIIEQYQEEQEEKLMHSDIDYAIIKYQDQIQEAYDILETVSKSLKSYGHELSPYEILKEL